MPLNAIFKSSTDSVYYIFTTKILNKISFSLSFTGYVFKQKTHTIQVPKYSFAHSMDGNKSLYIFFIFIFLSTNQWILIRRESPDELTAKCIAFSISAFQWEKQLFLSLELILYTSSILIVFITQHTVSRIILKLHLIKF